ncbi:hypothetical protein GP486_000048 [Trichoglossum hirsutum]|uniref:Uncharacterized protein n=1 Tax=Trichoglossum hirsutum TaxID=265104 RepID=A0A9P8LJ89_9PEZI|nr:hypothetical protein GP486_000048 [Trichoglossum hirsutum]
MKRARSVNTGSISSNTSSFRKRFGLHTLSRENSKTDPESKVGSVWRTLSKNARTTNLGELNSASSSNVSLVRSRSIDLDHQISPAKRPASRDRPTIFGTFSHEDSDRPRSSHLLDTPNTITASPATTITAVKSQPKKRRSSLSDLKILQDFDPDVVAPLTPWKSNALETSALRTPSPAKRPTTTLCSADLPSRKENQPDSDRNTLIERANNMKSNEAVITELRQPRGTSGSSSGIPTPKVAPRENQLENKAEQHHRNRPSSPQKLRMQSPQKLRERLQNEQRAITRVEDALQAEISKIGEDMSRATITQPHARSQTVDVCRLLDRVSQLESRIPIFVADLTERNTAIKRDLESSLTISERKAKRLDELYREGNAENEILYGRFNDELEKIISALKVGAGEKELADRLREVQDELSACKKENARLKRENVGLRAQLKGD